MRTGKPKAALPLDVTFFDTHIPQHPPRILAITATLEDAGLRVLLGGTIHQYFIVHSGRPGCGTTIRIYYAGTTLYGQIHQHSHRLNLNINLQLPDSIAKLWQTLYNEGITTEQQNDSLMADD